ncbi:HEXXH motif domain-containing protein [Actinomadura kijaniata]|uniref:HEXXH motif domain-containing protein n=1 Tax=Actinomadura kijaniata TaxID=46161 RepID=UPI00082DE876|nr:HEXXH motif domain-containing protein [Actinomadura kijaniata]
MFDDLAAGGGGAPAGRFLTSVARGRHMMLLRAVAEEPSSEAVRTAFMQLARIHSAAPGPVDQVVRHPAVGAWALSVVLSQGARPEAMAAVAAAAAVRAGLPLETAIPVKGGMAVLPSLGRALLGGPADEGMCTVRVASSGTTLTFEGTTVTVPPDPSADTGRWQGLRTVSAGQGRARFCLAIDDLDPYRFPSSAALASRLGEVDRARWQAMLPQAWALLWRCHRAVAQELQTMVSVLTPLTPLGGWPTSGTSRTTFGCVALAPPADATALALALAHEVQHIKLTGLLYLVDLVEPDSGDRFYAPWRHDLRPAAGLLHGVYAHLGVTGFWHRQRMVDQDDVSHAQFVRWRQATAQAAQSLLEGSVLTPLGYRFVEGVLGAVGQFGGEPVPARANEMAYRAAERHRRCYGLHTGEAPFR